MESMRSTFSAVHVFGVIFAIVWLVSLVLTGLNFYDFAQDWPSGLGISPMLFVWVPFAMGVFGFIAILCGIRQQRRMLDGFIPRGQESSRLVGPFAHHHVSGFSSEEQEGDVLDIPAVCSNCEYALSREGLEWVGPLEFKCPYCGHILQAKRTRI